MDFLDLAVFLYLDWACCSVGGHQSDRVQKIPEVAHCRRGAICAHFGWTLDYLTNGVAWSVVQKMMLDAPSYDMSDGEEEISLTESNRDSIMEYVNSLM